MQTLKAYLDELVLRFEQESFIQDDPVAIPHGFSEPRDQEIIGLFAALLAWGNRKTIQRKLLHLCELMEFEPYRFVISFEELRDGERLRQFKHRTFQPGDALWLVKNLQHNLLRFGSLERLFVAGLGGSESRDVGRALEGFSVRLASTLPESPPRLRKHLARPSTGSACKRLNLFLRWMVRPGPVDLGLWTCLSPRDLLLPLDVHSGRQARALGLLKRPSDDWRAVHEVTAACRRFSPEDPVRYDYVLFGLGAAGMDIDPRFRASPSQRARPASASGAGRRGRNK